MPFELSQWFFDWKTAWLASDECLAVRVVRHPHRGETHFPEIPADASDRQLARRGTAVAGDLQRYLLHVLESGSPAERPAAWRIVKRAAFSGGEHPVLQKWMDVHDTSEHGRQRIKTWLTCVRKGRRSSIWSEHINDECEEVSK